MFLMTHRASLMIPDCLACNDVLSELLVVVTCAFILSRISWTDPTRTVHLFAIM